VSAQGAPTIVENIAVNRTYARIAKIGEEGIGQRCFACDELISADQSGTTSRYQCRQASGQIHWFHQRCKIILNTARNPIGRDLVEEHRHQDRME
jgi:hypothetical protein